MAIRNTNMRKGMINLLIIAILSLCTLNVAVASTNRPTSADHGESSTGVTVWQPTMLTITAPAQANLNVSFYVNRTLTVGGKGIAGATAHFQMGDLTTSNWQTLWNCKTDVNGQFSTPVFLYWQRTTPSGPSTTATVATHLALVMRYQWQLADIIFRATISIQSPVVLSDLL